MLVLVVWMDVGIIVSGTVRPAVSAVHRAVQEVDASVGVLLLGGPLRRVAYVQDFGVVPFPGLALPQLPGLGLDPDGENSIRYADTKYQTFSVSRDYGRSEKVQLILQCIQFQFTGRLHNMFKWQ